MSKEIAEALKFVFTSPNVADANSEDANLVDVLNKMAHRLGKISESLESIANAIRTNRETN